MRESGNMIKNPELVNGYLVSVSLVKKRNEKKRIISRELKPPLALFGFIIHIPLRFREVAAMRKESSKARAAS